jgi:hypothetical protein
MVDYESLRMLEETVVSNFISYYADIGGCLCIQKFHDWLLGARTANVTALCH